MRTVGATPLTASSAIDGSSQAVTCSSAGGFGYAPWPHSRGRPRAGADSSTPDAAARAVASPPRPRRIIAAPTAIAAPISGPATYAQNAVQSPATRAGPNERAGFIEVPLTGAAHSPARAM